MTKKKMKEGFVCATATDATIIYTKATRKRNEMSTCVGAYV